MPLTDCSQVSRKVLGGTLLIWKQVILVRVLDLNNKAQDSGQKEMLLDHEPVVILVARLRRIFGAQHLQSTLEDLQNLMKDNE
ncbi:hypothetical protein AVEN_184213-1 [Araneus ventricosus]|uniref:Uncharacterized protein n=1 Tax=Araneus ventricosus TaxID=182803 RepID=A0A4Y2M435_ARAVE|nr:hypothetical protein AVEN_184213-1 [Araneus ventricosus]